MDEATFGLWGQWPAWDFEKEKNICIIDLKNYLDKKKKKLALSPQILAPWTKKCSNTKEKKPSKSEKEWMNYWLRWASQSLRMTSSSSWRLAALQINELLLSLQTVPFRPHHFAWSHQKLCSLCYFKFHTLSLSLSLRFQAR